MCVRDYLHVCLFAWLVVRLFVGLFVSVCVCSLICLVGSQFVCRRVVLLV